MGQLISVDGGIAVPGQIRYGLYLPSNFRYDGTQNNKMGWANSGYAQGANIYIDNIVIATKEQA